MFVKRSVELVVLLVVGIDIQRAAVHRMKNTATTMKDGRLVSTPLEMIQQVQHYYVESSRFRANAVSFVCNASFAS